MFTILITGGDGLLAYALRRMATPDFSLTFLSRRDFDLTTPAQMQQQLDTIAPHAVINTAAYNLVERCEQEREISWAVNAAAPEILATMCARKNVPLVHYSTDYVFDGTGNPPYTENDQPNPLNHYGVGKLAGERAVLAASPKNLALRTSWVFGPHPTQTKSYVHSILRAVRSGVALKSTTDQVSAPTFAEDLARWTLELIRQNAGGLFHAVNDESVSRFDWTKVILEEAVCAGLMAQIPPVEPVTTDFFKSTMPRPKNSALSNKKLAGVLKFSPGSWRAGLRKMLAEEAGHRLI